MGVEPKHGRIARELLAELAAGKYAAMGGRLPSEAQLVGRFGVSRPTVARALRDLQERGLVERRAGSGTFARAANAPELAARQFGLLIPGLGTTVVFEAICGELAGLARAQGYGLLWGGGAARPPGDLDADDAADLCDQFIRGRVAGVFFVPFEHPRRREALNRALADRLRHAGIAVVLLDRDLAPFPSRSDYDLVGVDNFNGGYRLADHLLKLGCRSLAYATRPDAASAVDARAAGARAAMLDRGLAVSPDFVRAGDPDDPEFAGRFRGRGEVEAVLCANDDLAARLLRALDRAGARAPGAIRVVGFDDAPIAALLPVPLTTIRQPCRDLAVVALRTMLDRIGEPALPPRAIALAPGLVVRESCGAYLGPIPGRGSAGGSG